jgi:two-component system response regulator WspF
MRIGIVNDTMIAVEALRRTLLHTRGHEVAWVARDGVEAVSRCAKDVPDLILMDLVMPNMDGVEATRRIMARNPCAIVVATASVNRNSSRVFAAMGAGALAAVNIPSLQSTGPTDEITEFLGRIQTINRLIRRDPGVKTRPTNLRIKPAIPPVLPKLIAIGASAGGPAALAAVLSNLPEDFPGAIVVVQHVDARFSRALTTTLDRQLKLPVRLARAGEIPDSGTVLIADSHNHLVIGTGDRLAYARTPHDTSYRPSIDVFFQSIVRRWPGEAVAVLLTGMGRDGAKGLKALRDAGHHTIVQDQATSAVYGMPKAAMELDAAVEILPLEKIGPRLAELIGCTPQ